MLDVHTAIIERGQALNYAMNKGGICYGASYLAMQAFLMNDTETFNRRILLLLSIPVDDIKNQVERAQDNIVKTRAHLKDDIFKENQGINKIKLHKILDEKLKVLCEKDATLKRDVDILNFLAFYDTLELYFANERYRDIVKIKNDGHSLQDAERVFNILLPDPLQHDRMLTRSISLTGVYDKDKLHKYFLSLEASINKNVVFSPFAMIMSSASHTIFVGFHPTKGWSLSDFNFVSEKDKYSIQEISSIDVLVNKIEEAFNHHKSQVVLEVKWYVAKNRAKSLEKMLHDWLISETMKNLQEVTEEKVRWVDACTSSWLQAAVKFGDVKMVKRLLVNNADINLIGVADISPLVWTILSSQPEILRLFLQEGGNPNFSGEKIPATPLSIAISTSNEEAFDLLIQYHADVNLEKFNDKLEGDFGPPLQFAIENERISFIVKLLHHPELVLTDSLKENLMHFALQLPKAEDKRSVMDALNKYIYKEAEARLNQLQLKNKLFQSYVNDSVISDKNTLKKKY